MKTILSLALAFYLTCGAAVANPPGVATETENPPEDPDWTINIVHENDLVDAGHDRNYTSGVMVAATSPPRVFDGPLWDLTKTITGINDGGLEVRQEFSISSLMFTPQDLARETPDALDRPFAGLVLASFGVIAADRNSDKVWETYPFIASTKRLDSLTLTVGTTGSASRSDDLQTWLHDEIDGVNPTGWRDQIPSRVLAGVSFQRTYGVALEGVPIDLFAHWGTTLGSIQTNANVGLSARIGINRPEDFGLPRIAPSVPSSGFFDPGDHGGGAYLFIGVQERYVAYDVTLDEGPRGEDPSIARTDWVGDAQIGWVAYWGPFHGGYTRVWRGRQFRSQRHEDSFGSWAVGFRTCLCRSSPFPQPWR